MGSDPTGYKRTASGKAYQKMFKVVVALSALLAPVMAALPEYVIHKSDRYDNGDRRYTAPRKDCAVIPTEDSQYPHNSDNIPAGLKPAFCLALYCGPDKPSFANFFQGWNSQYIQYCHDNCFNGVYCTNDFLQGGGAMCGCRGGEYE
jgi:hypothetical protein